MQAIDNGKKIEFSFEVDKKAVLWHLVHRSNMSEQQVQDLFQNNKAFKEKYMKLVMTLAKEYIEKELDEVDDLIQFAEQTEKRMKK